MFIIPGVAFLDAAMCTRVIPVRLSKMCVSAPCFKSNTTLDSWFDRRASSNGACLSSTTELATAPCSKSNLVIATSLRPFVAKTKGLLDRASAISGKAPFSRRICTTLVRLVETASSRAVDCARSGDRRLTFAPARSIFRTPTSSPRLAYHKRADPPSERTLFW